MSTAITANFNSLKPPLYSSLAMAFAGMGDAFLYPFLPLYSTSVGIPVAWVGIILSVNRFARIFLNPLIVKCFSRFGVKNITIAASILAVCCTLGYGLNLSITAWILFRIIWGLCFSALRISTASYAFSNQNKGLALGSSTGLYEIGPLIVLLIGPFLVLRFNFEHSLFIVAAASALSLFFVYKIPALPYHPANEEKPLINFPSTINLLSFFNSFIAEGLLVVTLGLLIQQYYNLPTPEVASAAAALLIFRRICVLAISPVGGMLVDRLGLMKILVPSVLMSSLGTILIMNNILMAGVVIVFSFSAITSVGLPIAASLRSADKIRSVAHNSIFRDAGAAFGTLTGGFLLGSLHLNWALAACIMLQVLLIFYWSKTVKLL